MILCCEQLTYLDTRPVSENDRVCIEAWRDGGAEAERALRQKIANEKHAKMEEDIRKLAKYEEHFVRLRPTLGMLEFAVAQIFWLTAS